MLERTYYRTIINNNLNDRQFGIGNRKSGIKNQFNRNEIMTNLVLGGSVWRNNKGKNKQQSTMKLRGNFLHSAVNTPLMASGQTLSYIGFSRSGIYECLVLFIP